MTKITAYTFEFFFDSWHKLNHKNKVDKSLCEHIWNRCNFSSLKESAIKDIKNNKGKYDSAYKYLKSKLTLIQK